MYSIYLFFTVFLNYTFFWFKKTHIQSYKNDPPGSSRCPKAAKFWFRSRSTEYLTVTFQLLKDVVYIALTSPGRKLSWTTKGPTLNIVHCYSMVCFGGSLMKILFHEWPGQGLKQSQFSWKLFKQLLSFCLSFYNKGTTKKKPTSFLGVPLETVEWWIGWRMSKIFM